MTDFTHLHVEGKGMMPVTTCVLLGSPGRLETTAQLTGLWLVFSEVNYVHVRHLLSPVRLSSVTFMRPTQAVQIFRNISMALGTLAIR